MGESRGGEKMQTAGKQLDEQAMRDELHRAVEKAGSVSAFARQVGIKQPQVSETVRGKRPMSARLLAALGYERVITYRKFR